MHDFFPTLIHLKCQGSLIRILDGCRLKFLFRKSQKGAMQAGVWFHFLQFSRWLNTYAAPGIRGQFPVCHRGTVWQEEELLSPSSPGYGRKQQIPTYFFVCRWAELHFATHQQQVTVSTTRWTTLFVRNVLSRNLFPLLDPNSERALLIKGTSCSLPHLGHAGNNEWICVP